MMARFAIAAVLASACVTDTTPPPPDPARPPPTTVAPAPEASEPAPAPAPPERVPSPTATPRAVAWFPGFAATSSSTRALTADDAALGAGRADCPTGDLGAIAITADVAPAPGRETVVASTAHGVVITDTARRRIATAALDCGGSADSIDGLALGRIDAVGPVIAVLSTIGGHRMATTAITLFRIDVGPSGALALRRVMTAPIVERDGDTTASGGLDVTADGLTYRDPYDGVTTWTYDRGAGVFVPAP